MHRSPLLLGCFAASHSEVPASAAQPSAESWSEASLHLEGPRGDGGHHLPGPIRFSSDQRCPVRVANVGEMDGVQLVPIKKSVIGFQGIVAWRVMVDFF